MAEENLRLVHIEFLQSYRFVQIYIMISFVNTETNTGSREDTLKRAVKSLLTGGLFRAFFDTDYRFMIKPEINLEQNPQQVKKLLIQALFPPDDLSDETAFIFQGGRVRIGGGRRLLVPFGRTKEAKKNKSIRLKSAAAAAEYVPKKFPPLFPKAKNPQKIAQNYKI